MTWVQCYRNLIWFWSSFLKFSLSSSLFSSNLQVKDIVKLLWENESQLCSFISDIQQQGLQMKDAYSIFFLETILVPPIKFRPPSKGGDSVCTCSWKKILLFFKKVGVCFLLFLLEFVFPLIVVILENIMLVKDICAVVLLANLAILIVGFLCFPPNILIM